MRLWIIAVVAATWSLPALGETPMQLAGRATAYAEQCGYYADAAELKAVLSENAEYQRSLRTNDLTGADIVMGLDCAAVERVMKQFLTIAERAKAPQADPDKVHCLQPEAAATMLLSRADCDRLHGRVYPEATRIRK